MRRPRSLIGCALPGERFGPGLCRGHLYCVDKPRCQRSRTVKIPRLWDMPSEKLAGMPPCSPVVPTPWHPPVGVFIGLLGLLGVLVPLLREKIGLREKASWTLILTVCLLLELRSIRLDQIQHDREQDFAVCQQLHSFQAIADSLSKASTTNQTQYDTTIKQVGKVLDTTQKNLDAISGGNSFAYILPNLYPAVTVFRMSITNNGSNPLFGVEVRMSKIATGDCDYFEQVRKATKGQEGKTVTVTIGPCTLDDGISPIAVGSLSGRETLQIPGAIDAGADCGAKYIVQVTAQNGHSLEVLRFRKAKNGNGCAYSESVTKSKLIKDGLGYDFPVGKDIEWVEPN